VKVNRSTQEIVQHLGAYVKENPASRDSTLCLTYLDRLVFPKEGNGFGVQTSDETSVSKRTENN